MQIYGDSRADWFVPAIILGTTLTPESAQYAQSYANDTGQVGKITTNSVSCMFGHVMRILR